LRQLRDVVAAEESQLGMGVLGAARDAERVRVLAVHWRRGDFVRAKRGMIEKVCVDELRGEAQDPCLHVPIVAEAEDLARTIRERMASQNCSALFLASNADEAEVAKLTDLLHIRPLRYRPTIGSGFDNRGMRAVLDGIICASSDSFVGSRSSLFTRNIIEERALQALPLNTSVYA